MTNVNDEYRKACIEEMKKDLVDEFLKLMDNENVSGKKRDQIFKLIMDVIYLAQQK